DLARGAVVDRRAVEDREHRVRALDPGAVLREDPRRRDVDARRELVLVRDEDLDAVGSQHRGALVDERALVRREERAGEVDLQAFRSHTIRSPSSVRNGSTSRIVFECGAIRSARPPVAITGASGAPSSPRIASAMPSTWPAKP